MASARTLSRTSFRSGVRGGWISWTEINAYPLPTGSGSCAASPFFSSNARASSGGLASGGFTSPRARGSLFCTVKPCSRAASSRLLPPRSAAATASAFSCTRACSALRHHALPDRLLDLREGRDGLVLARDGLDQVVAEVGPDHVRHLARGQGEGRVVELGHHAAARETSEVAALRRRSPGPPRTSSPPRRSRRPAGSGPARSARSGARPSSECPSVASGVSFTLTRMWLAHSSSSCWNWSRFAS